MFKVGEPGFWFDSLDRPVPRRPRLEGDTEVDVAIVGGGYTGLWTAYYLSEADPDLRIAVLEKEHVGFGASGRNGGWVSGFFTGPFRVYDREKGKAGAVNLQRQMFATVDEVGRVIEAEGIEADFVKGGNLGVALNGGQAERGRRLVREYHHLGFTAEDIDFLGPEETRERINMPAAIGSVFSPHVARVQPAKLVLGLADAVEKRGVQIHEETRVTEIRPHQAVTTHGVVSARWVVRATEGYTANLRGLKRLLVPMNSSMVVSEPLPDELWQEIGWQNFEVVHDIANAYCYLQRTADGRLTIGGRGRPYRYGSRTEDIGLITRATVEALRQRLLLMLPQLGEVRFSHGWSGVLGVPRDWCLYADVDREAGIATAGGYVGEGVAASNLSGRTLRDLILGRDTELTRQSWVGRRPPRWEPEPLRYLAIRTVYGLYRQADRNEARTGQISRLGLLVDKLSGRH